MQKQQNENLKKVLIALVVMLMFFASYYYYTSGKNKKIIAKSPAKHEKVIAQKTAAPEKLSEATTVPVVPVVATEQPTPAVNQDNNKIKENANINENNKEAVDEKVNEGKQEEPKKIKPTDIKDLMANAMDNSGKKDPFSYSESRFSPFKKSGSGSANIDPKTVGMLPPPPFSTGYTPSEPAEPAEMVVIKGFIGNKVIAQIMGNTESLGVNESLQGVKVLSIDQANLSCVFQIEGKKVKKIMQPITKPSDDILINYVHN